MQQTPRDHEAGPGKRVIFWLSLGFGLFIGLVAGLGIVFHDGKSWMEGALGGLGLFGFGFAIMYLRYARKLAELLSIH
jgi:hypothetical protein